MKAMRDECESSNQILKDKISFYERKLYFYENPNEKDEEEEEYYVDTEDIDVICK